MEINNYKTGMDAQKEAEKFLQASGYKILTRNYCTKTGEIDIIAKRENYTIFAEIKYRRGLRHGLPRESVGKAKQKKIIKTALYYISANNLVDCNFRFDVIEIFEKNETRHINHIENAFDTSVYSRFI